MQVDPDLVLSAKKNVTKAFLFDEKTLVYIVVGKRFYLFDVDFLKE